MSETNAVGLLKETFTLPSGAQAEIRELTGREEDLLSDERVLKSGKLTQRLLGNILLSLNGKKPTSADVSDMWSADRFAAVLYARVLSYGGEFVTNHDCTTEGCKTTIRVSASLPDDLKYVEFTGDATVDVDLPGGQVATMRPLKGADEDALLTARQRGELLTELLFCRTVKVTGIESRQELRTFLRDGSVRARKALRDALPRTDFGYAQFIPISCPTCGEDQQVDVMSSKDFFFPSSED